MLTKAAKKQLDHLFPENLRELFTTDPELIEVFSNFAFDEILGREELDEKTCLIAIMASLIGSSSVDCYKTLLPGVLGSEVSPTEIKEIVYQGVVYMGMGRMLPFIEATNEVFRQASIDLPLPKQSQTTPITRLDSGIEKQVELFGEDKRDFYQSGEGARKTINYWVSENAYGDYYTRSGLDGKTREMITFCFLAAQGGCETQLKTHIGANLHVGNDPEFLAEILFQCLPYIGYPRTFNALTCLEECTKKEQAQNH